MVKALFSGGFGRHVPAAIRKASRRYRQKYRSGAKRRRPVPIFGGSVCREKPADP